jgi:hypothetical protein
MEVAILAAYRYATRMTRDLETAAEAADDLLSLRIMPDDLAARLASFRDDVELALEDRQRPAEGAPRN